jgi:hypothetical protein
LGRSTRTVNRNTESLIAASKETAVAVNAEEDKHVVVSYNQHAGQNHNVVGDKSSERVEQVKYLGTTIKIHELIYQLNAIEYLLCTFSSTCFGFTRPSSAAMDVKFLYIHSIWCGIWRVALLAVQHATCTHTPQDRHLTTPRTPYAAYVKKFNIHCS